MIYDRREFEEVIRSTKSWQWKRKLIVAMVFENDKAKSRASRRSNARRKPRNCNRNRGYALDEMNRLSDSTFRRMFRLTRAAFNELVTLLDPMIVKNPIKATNSSGSSISTRTRLAVTLRWLAGGQQIDLCFAWGIGEVLNT